jgi:hypothetical protein
LLTVPTVARLKTSRSFMSFHTSRERMGSGVVVACLLSSARLMKSTFAEFRCKLDGSFKDKINFSSLLGHLLDVRLSPEQCAITIASRPGGTPVDTQSENLCPGFRLTLEFWSRATDHKQAMSGLRLPWERSLISAHAGSPTVNCRL